jgi:hypothetical protein
MPTNRTKVVRNERVTTVDSLPDRVATPNESRGADQPDHDRIGLDLLAEHVPLTLMIDLASAVDSHEVYVEEGGTADWLQAVE